MFRRWAFPLLVFSAVCNPQPSFSSSDGPYWQQRVHYTIAVELDPSHHRMKVTERLVYFNSSPDTVREVYYHLYLNAFKPSSMMEKRGTELGTSLGGGNLRGYYRDFSTLFGEKILAVNVDIELKNPLARVLKGVPLVSSVEPYLFLDVGQSWDFDPPSLSGFLDNCIADAGVESRWKPFRYLSRGETLRSARTVLLSFFPFLRSLHLEGALPFWLSDPSGGESRLRARWTLRLSSSVEL